ncbi:MAG: hypothetical protein LKI42_06180, partial [Bacteroidales bacterium]|nr:hypothetical protein [Bacteroidales bacterium]
ATANTTAGSINNISNHNVKSRVRGLGVPDFFVRVPYTALQLVSYGHYILSYYDCYSNAATASFNMLLFMLLSFLQLPLMHGYCVVATDAVGAISDDVAVAVFRVGRGRIKEGL